MNDIFVVGLNHKIAPLAVRERLVFSPERLPTALHQIATLLPAESPDDVQETSVEAVILSTCNRTEVYIWASTHKTPDTGPTKPQKASPAETSVRHFLSDYGQLSPDGLNTILYVYRGAEAAYHLMRVAAGLDSLVVGENEILGQVKDAYAMAHTAGTTGPILSTLFRCAIQAGKRVRTETEIGRAALSVATIVVELAEETYGSLVDHTALLIGAGKMSSLTARALVKAGLRCVLVANRTYERAQKLAQSLGGKAVRFDALTENLIAADIVICSTGAPHTVLHVEDVQTAMTARPNRPLLVTDLAVPHDADPSIGALAGVHLVDIDDLEELVQTHHPLAVAVRQTAEAIVNEALEDFKTWYDARLSVPVICALRAKAETIYQAELERTLRRLDNLTPQQQQTIEAMGRAIVNKLLHEPTVHLKDPPPGITRIEYLNLTQTLFGLH